MRCWRPDVEAWAEEDGMPTADAFEPVYDRDVLVLAGDISTGSDA